MIELSNGVWKPEDGDKGSVFFPKLVLNFEQLNDHNHNGTNSEKLAPGAVTAASITLANTNWDTVSLADSVYKQRFEIPGGLTFDNVTPSVRDASTGEVVFVSVVKVNDTHVDVFVNDTSVSLKVIFR